MAAAVGPVAAVAAGAGPCYRVALSGAGAQRFGQALTRGWLAVVPVPAGGVDAVPNPPSASARRGTAIRRSPRPVIRLRDTTDHPKLFEDLYRAVQLWRLPERREALAIEHELRAR